MAGRCACNQVCNCCVQASPTVSVAGVGIPGSCFRPQVIFSTETKNQASAGTDGAVYVKPSVLLDRTGTPIVSNSLGQTQLPAPCVLDYNGNPITPTAGGCVQLPTAGVPPPHGAGLTTALDGTLIADVSGVWPTADAQGASLTGADTDGAEIYVDGSGQLRAPAEHTSIAAANGNDLVIWAGPADGSPTLQPVATTVTTNPSDTLTVINPSPARQMTLLRNLAAIVDCIVPQGSSVLIDLEGNFDNAGWGILRRVSWPEYQPAGSATIRYKGPVSQPASAVTLGPGDSTTINLRVTVTKNGGGAVNPVLVYVRSHIDVFGVTR